MESTGRSSFSQYWRLIQGNANFRRLWIAQMISETGDWMYIVAIYDQLLRITGGAANSAASASMKRRWHTTARPAFFRAA